MTINELLTMLEDARDQGFGNGRVMFDTEAKTFNYHMAEIGYAFVELDPTNEDRECLILYEKKQ